MDILESVKQWKTLHFMIFCTCDFITDRSIASYENIVASSSGRYSDHSAIIPINRSMT